MSESLTTNEDKYKEEVKKESQDNNVQPPKTVNTATSEPSESSEDTSEVKLKTSISSPTLDVSKHPLNTEWTLWYDFTPRHGSMTGNEKQYEQGLQTVYSFKTVEDFWCLKNTILPPSNLRFFSNYRLFRTGIKPAWEDEKNKLGGAWIIKLNFNDHHNVNEMWRTADHSWEKLLLIVIGELFDNLSMYVTGVVCSVRHRFCKLSLWVSVSADKYDPDVLELGKRFREFLEVKKFTISQFNCFFPKVVLGRDLPKGIKYSLPKNIQSKPKKY